MSAFSDFLTYLDRLFPSGSSWSRSFFDNMRRSFAHLHTTGAIPYDNAQTYDAGVLVTSAGQLFISLVDGIPIMTGPTPNTGDANWGILSAATPLTGLPVSFNALFATGNNGAGVIDLVTNGLSGSRPSPLDKVAFVYNVTDGTALTIGGPGNDFAPAIGTTGGATGHATLTQQSATNLSAKNLLIVTFAPHN